MGIQTDGGANSGAGQYKVGDIVTVAGCSALGAGDTGAAFVGDYKVKAVAAAVVTLMDMDGNDLSGLSLNQDDGGSCNMAKKGKTTKIISIHIHQCYHGSCYSFDFIITNKSSTSVACSQSRTAGNSDNIAYFILSSARISSSIGLYGNCNSTDSSKAASCKSRSDRCPQTIVQSYTFVIVRVSNVSSSCRQCGCCSTCVSNRTVA